MPRTKKLKPIGSARGHQDAWGRSYITVTLDESGAEMILLPAQGRADCSKLADFVALALNPPIAGVSPRQEKLAEGFWRKDECNREYLKVDILSGLTLRLYENPARNRREGKDEPRFLVFHRMPPRNPKQLP